MWWKANRDRCNAERRGKAYPPLGEVSKQALMQNELYATAAGALPGGLPNFVRDDVISEMVLAVLEGRLTVAAVAGQAKRFLSAHYANYQNRAFVSLDVVKPGRKVAWVETLAAEPVTCSEGQDAHG